MNLTPETWTISAFILELASSIKAMIEASEVGWEAGPEDDGNIFFESSAPLE